MTPQLVTTEQYQQIVREERAELVKKLSPYEFAFYLPRRDRYMRVRSVQLPNGRLVQELHFSLSCPC